MLGWYVVLRHGRQGQEHGDRSPSKGAQDTNPLRFDADLRQRRLPVATGAEAEAIINFQLANGVSFQSKLLVR